MPNAQPLLDDLGPFPAQLAQFQPESLRFVDKARLRPPVQRQGAARRVPRDLSPQVDSHEHGRPIPRSSRHVDRAVSQRSLADGDAKPASRLGGPGHPRHEAHRNRDGDFVEEQSVVEFLSEPRRAVRSDGRAVPAVLADRRRFDADRVSLVRAGHRHRRDARTVADPYRELRPDPRRGPAVRRTTSSVRSSRPASRA